MLKGPGTPEPRLKVARQGLGEKGGGRRLTVKLSVAVVVFIGSGIFGFLKAYRVHRFKGTDPNEIAYTLDASHKFGHPQATGASEQLAPDPRIHKTLSGSTVH